MKKNNIILAGVLLVVFILGLVGVTLAKSQEEPAGAIIEDHLVGVFVTTENLDLFDFDNYLNDNAEDIVNGRKVDDDNSYEGRLYATYEDQVRINEETGETITRQEYVFGDIEGFSYFTVTKYENDSSYTALYGDDVFSEGNTSLTSTDNGKNIKIEGTIYMLPNIDTVFYMNPVYQSASGEIYAMQGQGISGSMGTEGSDFSQTLEASYTVTEDQSTRTDSTSVEISISVLYEPVNIEVIEFDENNEIVASNEYTPGEVPKNINLMPDTEYIVVTTQKTKPQDGFVYSREIYQKDDTSVTTFYGIDDGILRTQYTSLVWY